MTATSFFLKTWPSNYICQHDWKVCQTQYFASCSIASAGNNWQNEHKTAGRKYSIKDVIQPLFLGQIHQIQSQATVVIS